MLIHRRWKLLGENETSPTCLDVLLSNFQTRATCTMDCVATLLHRGWKLLWENETAPTCLTVLSIAYRCCYIGVGNCCGKMRLPTCLDDLLSNFQTRATCTMDCVTMLLHRGWKLLWENETSHKSYCFDMQFPTPCFMHELRTDALISTRQTKQKNKNLRQRRNTNCVPMLLHRGWKFHALQLC